MVAVCKRDVDASLDGKEDAVASDAYLRLFKDDKVPVEPLADGLS